jgi:polar amino acid transport system permease protein
MSDITTPIDAGAAPDGARRGLMDTISAPLTDPRSIWMYALLLVGALMVVSIIVNDLYAAAFEFLVVGVGLTIVMSLSAFTLAQLLGLMTALGRVSSNLVLYNISTFYVEVVRGIPIIVQLIYMAFVIFPALVAGMNSLGDAIVASDIAWVQQLLGGLGQSLADVTIRDMKMEIRAVLGLATAYGAYEAEVYRAGIQSIEKGQMEAARSLGMSYVQAMRYVILPQAIRRVLPPIGNDFVAILKDSSLVSVLAVNDLTHKGDLHRARTFRTFETWNTVTFLYLILTISFTRVVRALERRMSTE